MGVDTNLSLPGNVRVKDVASVAGLLRGLPIGPAADWCEVRGASVRGHESIPEMCRIDLRHANGDALASFYYHFESRGGRRLLSCRSTPENIAMCKRLADFFGGSVDFVDYDEKKTDYVVPDKSDDENHPEDGVPWESLQARMRTVKQLSRHELREAKEVAAYT